MSLSHLEARWDAARDNASIAFPKLATDIQAMYLRDMRKRAADLSEDMDAASKLLQHSSLYAGPLFIHQLSHVWVDFRGIRDACMRECDLDYFESSRRATLVQQQYATHNPMGFAHYDRHTWGITASDGPGPKTMMVDGVERTFHDYLARGAPYGPDDGTLAPWAVVDSLPFAPEIVLPTLDNYARMHLNEAQEFGYKATFRPRGIVHWLAGRRSSAAVMGASRAPDASVPRKYLQNSAAFGSVSTRSIDWPPKSTQKPKPPIATIRTPYA